MADYRSLLRRLLGLYVPLELALSMPPDRSLRLQADLGTLKAPKGEAAVELCPYIPRFDDAAQRLGARYVVEGAAMGGRLLATRLNSLLGEGPIGRLFFIGRRTGSACAWQAFLSELAAFEDDTASHVGIIKAACDTFDACENWLAGWSELGTR